MSEKKRKLLSLFAIALFVLFLAAVGFFIGVPLVRFLGDPAAFRAWVEENGVWGILAFLAMQVFQVVCAFVPGEPMEIGAGYAFGALWGTLFCQAGILVGSLLIFLFVRRFGVRVTEVFFPPEKVRGLRFLREEKRLRLLIFFLFLIPGTPKDLLCYVAPLTEIDRRTFLLISFFARIPSVLSSAVVGDALGSGEYASAAIVFAATALVSLAGVLLYERIRSKKNAASAAREENGSADPGESA